MVIGESSSSRHHNRPLRSWLIGGSPIPEVDELHYMGVLQTVHFTTVYRTVERCSAGRSSFFALNVVGSRFGCLHPLTSLWLYSSFCIPLMLYGCELWSPTKSEILMLERVHRKILRTIQGLPMRCHHLALQTLVGSSSIHHLIYQRQLCFAYSFSGLPRDSLALRVMNERLLSSPTRGVIPRICSILADLCLPPLSMVLQGVCSRAAWKKQVRSLTMSSELSQFLTDCDHLPLSHCSLSTGKPVPHWAITRGLPALTRMNNFRVRLLVRCDGLELDASRFRYRLLSSRSTGDPTCPLCLWT